MTVTKGCVFLGKISSRNLFIPKGKRERHDLDQIFGGNHVGKKTKGTSTMKLFKATFAFSILLLILSDAYSSEVNENMIKAAGKGDIDTVKNLLSKGADINAKLEGSKWTALHLAAAEGHTEMVELLIERGADVNVKDAVKNDPLRRAAINGHIKIVEILLYHGSNVNARGRYGLTALMGAAQYGYTDIVKILVENGADVNIKSDLGDTALSRAMDNGHSETMRFLKASGAKQ